MFHRDSSAENVGGGQGSTGRQKRLGSIRRVSDLFHRPRQTSSGAIGGPGNDYSYYGDDQSTTYSHELYSVNEDWQPTVLVPNSSSDSLLVDTSTDADNSGSTLMLRVPPKLPPRGNTTTSSFDQNSSLTTNASNVEFNNVRTNTSSSNNNNNNDEYDNAANEAAAAAAPLSNPSLHKSSSQSSMAANAGRLGKLFQKQMQKQQQRKQQHQQQLRRRRPSESNSQHSGASGLSAGSTGANTTTSTLSTTGEEGLLAPDLTLQTSLLPANRDNRSPLARTSKEVERIAGYGTVSAVPERLAMSTVAAYNNSTSPTLASTGETPDTGTGVSLSSSTASSSANILRSRRSNSSLNSMASGGKGSWRSRHHFPIRSRKDTVKSSSSSNSRLTQTGIESRYSFHPSSNSTALSANDLQSMIEELEHVSNEKGDSAAITVDKEAIADEAWSIFCSLVSPIFQGGRLKAPMEEINKLVLLHTKLTANMKTSQIYNTYSAVPESPTTTVYTPLSQPAPTFSSSPYSALSSPIGVASPTPTALTPSISPMFPGQSKEVDEIHEFLKSGMNAMVSLLYYDNSENMVKLGRQKQRLTLNSRTALVSTDSNFERSCSLMWDMFYDDVYFYLQGVFLPLESHVPSGSAADVRSVKLPVADIVLVSFRDNIVIPLYEMNRQIEAQKERSHEAGTTPRNIIEPSEESYTLNVGLLQCFTILYGVQTNDTNQKIIENLMQQTREKCMIYEQSVPSGARA